jgi:hypothetical protein
VVSADLALDVCNAQNIKVHLFATSTMKSYFHLIRCNCAPHFPDSQSHSSSHSGINVTRINRFLNAILPGSEYDRHATADADGYFTPTYTPDTPTNSYLGVQYASPPIPAYSQSPAGLPVNLGQGGALTELRGIFIQGLHYGAKNSDVTSILYSIGLVPVQVRVLRNSQGNSKGCASVDCNTAQDAQRGVALLNGIIHMDKKLEVRLDREPTVVGHVSSFLVGGYPIVDSRNKSGVSLVVHVRKVLSLTHKLSAFLYTFDGA